MDKILSGSELRQYLHISTRKMKYLLDHGYIPCENNGQATHKHSVRLDDADEFKRKSETQPGFLSELSGVFTSRKCGKKPLMFEATEANCAAFCAYLTEKWADFPDALPTQQAAALVGCQPQKLHKAVADSQLHGVKIGSVQYIVKEEFITYIAAPVRLSAATSETLRIMIMEFKKRQKRKH